ncbi:amylo-alpha-1,6-glucosidase [Desulfatitalea tepidiphila]|uniref:amylo-alpha-1,6-glucosidase n=1 Tax=Desulfatitalea tepidiphila TaxID=1185843 RepID=UPI0006B69B24|nr:amylo-alpha-1,6-glucosidase [Desulfatitalea tepidiphila]
MASKTYKNVQIHQTPAPGSHILRFRGDMIHLHLHVAPSPAGAAYVRTNLGKARIIRREIIRNIEFNEAPQARDWYDIPMIQTGEGHYEVSLPLNEVGHFEAKCLFLPEDRNEPLWPPGSNTAINVEPADTVCGNIIYNAFVRQFGPNKGRPYSDMSDVAECMRVLDNAHYTVIPPSGTFRDVIAELDFIMGRLGCRLLQLLPINPPPTTYARMGRYGSPYAALSFTAVDRALAVFDPAATPLEQFIELVDAVHARRGKVILDIAINHTGWAASLHETHPQWLVRQANGEIKNPGAWGVVWADLTSLDYSHQDMWTYMADVFLTWCRRGVDGFRCDAGYMIPLPAWQYIIAKVRDQFSDALFLLEGLGGKISVTRDLLDRANFNWAYSELFQNYDRSQIEHYLPEALEISDTDGITVHFAETHDNNRLAATSATYARMRTALCALLAPNGAFGFANGVEWLATEKINVHEACALNWGASENQVDVIAHLSRLLKTHPAFGPGVQLTLIHRGEGNFIALARHHLPSGRGVVVVANLDAVRPVTAGWDAARAPFLKPPVIDLVSGQPVAIVHKDELGQIDLAAGQVVCLADSRDGWASAAPEDPYTPPPAVLLQCLRAKALEVMVVFRAVASGDLDAAARRLQADPEAFCRGLDPRVEMPRLVRWQLPTDLRREVMVPPGFLLLVHAPHPMRARIVEGERVLAQEDSLAGSDGHAFVLFAPLPTPVAHRPCELQIVSFEPDGPVHHRARLLYLADGRNARVRTAFSRNECHQTPLLVLGTNGRGAMMRVRADWRRLDSRYDALLAANLNPDFPEDRRILLARCRGWVVYQGYSQEIKPDCLEHFGFDYEGGAWWRYQIIAGQGEHIVLQVRARMLPDRANMVAMQFERLHRISGEAELADDQAVTLVIRPDIEDRNFHECTKAFSGPETLWPNALTAHKKGFRFAPGAHHALVMQQDQGRFEIEPEWYYMVHRSLEAGRGLDPNSDLFSPGYFSCPLRGGQRIMLTAWVETPSAPKAKPPAALDGSIEGDDMPLEGAMAAALKQYVVLRGEFNTVIAGFPWFLDWGRDTLIVVRGLIAAGHLETSRAILLQFAQFEANGTLPNMIRGNDAGNRDTSDAPLWFFTACADLAVAEGRDDFLDQHCERRSIRQILVDMAGALMAGTPNGIRMDPGSGLLFSPAHFTWMDTNYPAGTPREGYPIEIQALWYAALVFLSDIDPAAGSAWKDLAQRVRNSIQTRYWLPDAGHLSDCLHGSPGTPADQARPDDALRPNQLLAITLGAVEDPEMVRRMLDACQRLLVPGAIRSLADQPVKAPLVIQREGQLLNDPMAPYWGQYQGDEDTRRKPAYHNGTAWTWPFPLFCEAWVQRYGRSAAPAALAWLSSSLQLINSHCVGHVPEIVDGDIPHTQRGCDAQAWGVSELLRVWRKVRAV